jgi:tetratricopeptide (TPR) repeat protein
MPYYGFPDANRAPGFGGDDRPFAGPSYASQPAREEAAQAQLEEARRFSAHGQAAFRAGDYDVAARSWQHALVEDPNSGALALLLGQAWFAAGRFNEAAGAVEHGMSLLPQDEWGMVVGNYAGLYRGNQEYTVQLRALETASKNKKTDSAAVRFLLGYPYAYLGYPQDGARELEKMLTMEPKDELAKKMSDEVLAMPEGGQPAAETASRPGTPRE